MNNLKLMQKDSHKFTHFYNTVITNKNNIMSSSNSIEVKDNTLSTPNVPPTISAPPGVTQAQDSEGNFELISSLPLFLNNTINNISPNTHNNDNSMSNE